MKFSAADTEEKNSTISLHNAFYTRITGITKLRNVAYYKTVVRLNKPFLSNIDITNNSCKFNLKKLGHVIEKLYSG